jgi:hypothetical protein
MKQLEVAIIENTGEWFHGGAGLLQTMRDL